MASLRGLSAVHGSVRPHPGGLCTCSVRCAAGQDPFGGYGYDGDDHWTPDGVRDWWRGRGRVREWLREALADQPPDEDVQQITAGAAWLAARATGRLAEAGAA